MCMYGHENTLYFLLLRNFVVHEKAILDSGGPGPALLHVLSLMRIILSMRKKASSIRVERIRKTH